MPARVPPARGVAPPADITRPFTSAWYRHHPAAWQIPQPSADVWKGARADELAAWVGGAVQQTAYAADTSAAADSANETAVPNERGADGLFSVLVRPKPAADVPQDPLAFPAEQPESGRVTRAATGTAADWLPLGVFSAASPGAAQPHVFLQLAVNRRGELRGTYFDSISNAVQPVIGSVNADTRKAAWTVGEQGGAAFETTLDRLAATPSPVTMRVGASTQSWEMMRLERPVGE